MIEMYPAMVNSEPTTLTGALSATDTTLHVALASAIPDAPNLLVIGADTANPETVKLTSKTGTVLTVIRGFQATARAWGAGSLIARNFTAYDHDTFIENVTKNNAHRTEALPHSTADGLFNYGFRVDENGVLIFMYEERA
jgi:hypothetical protein